MMVEGVEGKVDMIMLEETVMAAVAQTVLEELGLASTDSRKAVATFKQHDEKRLWSDHASHNDEQKMVYLAQRSARELEELFDSDADEQRDAADPK